MRDKKTYIFLLIIILTFGIAMFVFFAIPEIKDKKKKATFIVGNDTIWQYKDKTLSNINSSLSKNLNWEQFKLYSDNKYLGNYYLVKDDQWYVFDKNKNAINLNGQIFAYKSNYKINLLDFTTKKISTDKYVNQVLSENNISSSSKFTSLTKTDVDIDNDGELESLYVVSNVFIDDVIPQYTFSFVFMVKENKIYKIYNDVRKFTAYGSCLPKITSILDIDGDGTYELILSCGKYSIQGNIDMLYHYDSSEFKILISNQ